MNRTRLAKQCSDMPVLSADMQIRTSIFTHCCHETNYNLGVEINCDNILFEQFGSWVCIELRDGMRLEPTHYAVRHGLVRELYACQNFGS